MSKVLIGVISGVVGIVVGALGYGVVQGNLGNKTETEENNLQVYEEEFKTIEE